MKLSFYTTLFIACMDYLGVGLIYPLFSTMLFDVNCPLLPPETSNSIRGIYLGILFCLMPLMQFITSPLWGAASDSKGRKKPLILSLYIALLGYLTALIGTFFTCLPILLLSRLLIGSASGNTAILQASISDISTPENKTKNFGLYSMVLGIGFTLGPLFGGVLSSYSYSAPFLVATALVVLNILFTRLFFKEPNQSLFHRPISILLGFLQIKKALHFKGLRTFFLAAFLNVFGWSYFFEFSPVFLISRLHFSPADLGLFFGIAGAFYALSAGFLIRPFLKRFKPETLFFSGLLLTALSIYLIPLFPEALWPTLFLICFFTSLTSPTTTTLISNASSTSSQGEMLGILSSVSALAMILSPLLSGSFVGNNPTSPMWIGGSVMLLASFCLLIRKALPLIKNGWIQITKRD